MTTTNAYYLESVSTLSCLGIHLADVPGTAISSPWDFPPKLPVIFVRLLGKGEFLEQRHVQVRLGFVTLRYVRLRPGSGHASAKLLCHLNMELYAPPFIGT